MKLTPVFMRRAGVSLLVLALLGAFGWVLARSGPLAPIRVTTVQVEEGTQALALFGIGTVEARRAYLIGPTVAGRVLRVGVDVGDAVTAGQVLAELDPVDLDERTAASQAAIARAGSLLVAAEAQLRDAQARREVATINARRYVELGGQRFVSTSAVEASSRNRFRPRRRPAPRKPIWPVRGRRFPGSPPSATGLASSAASCVWLRRRTE
jgi:HlyD family secretion protein